MKEFKIKDKVYVRRDITADNLGYYHGEVLFLTDAKKAIIKNAYGSLTEFDLADLCFEVEAEEIQDELKAKRNALEAQFAETKISIQEKIKEATELLQQASDICVKNGKSFYQFKEDCYDLVSILKDSDIVEWESSSANC
jgi:hypothetical protein